MKTKPTLKVTTALLSLSTLIHQPSSSFAQGTAFTYQGRLNNGASPATGIYDLRFTIYDSSGGPTIVAGPMTNSPVAVSNGLFTVTLDFGAGVFTGAERWVEIGVRSNGLGEFTALTPRQPLTAAPYAIFAPNAGTAASVAANVVGTGALQTSAVTADKIADGTITAADVNSASFSNKFWMLDGNVGTTPGTHFLGTTDNQPLELRVNGQRAWRLEPGASNSVQVIGGWSANHVAPGVAGATIAGGGAGDYLGNALSNRVHADFGTVSGGAANGVLSNSTGATIAGGFNNGILSDNVAATIAGGQNNFIWSNAAFATIGGGVGHAIQSNARHATVGGGYYNTIQGNATNATIGGGRNNTVQASALAATIAGGQNNGIRSEASFAVIAGGSGNAILPNALHGVVGGGYFNAIQTNASFASLGGGYRNQIGSDAVHGVIAGGQSNVIATAAGFSAILGGSDNTITANGEYAAIPGGQANRATNYAFAAGRHAQADHTGSFVWADSQDADFASTTSNQFNIRASGGVRFQADGAGMTVDGQPVLAGRNGATLTNLNASQLTSGVVADARVSGSIARVDQVWRLGGNAGTAPGAQFLGTTDDKALEFKVNRLRALRLEDNGDGQDSGPEPDGAPNLIGGSPGNSVSAGVVGATISGGGATNWYGFPYPNTISSDFGTIGGGQDNSISANAVSSTIGGGYHNEIGAYSDESTIAGGRYNKIGTNAVQSVIGGGGLNTIAANGEYATIPGGFYNAATNFAFAAGRQAKANHTGAFVWADAQGVPLASTAPNQFLIRAAGGVGIGTTAPDAPLHVQSGSVGVDLNSRTVLGVERAGDTFIQVLTTTSNYAGVVFGSAYNSLDASVRYNAWSKRDLSFRTDNSTRMIILTNGNVGIANTSPTDLLMVSNARCDGSSWINASDRRLKQDFSAVDPQAVLEKVVDLPVQQWSYQAQPDQKHLGPVAQDFHAAFGLGADDTSIATVDADGVALAAIQGLNQKLEQQLKEKEAHLASQQQQITELLRRLGALERKLNPSETK